MIFLNKALLENTNITEVQLSRLSEDSKAEMADKVVSRLYKIIQKKSKEIDIPEIESTNGDVTKLEGFKDLQNALAFLSKVSKSGTNTDFSKLIEDLQDSVTFLLTYKEQFMKGYAKNNTIVKCCYVSMTAITIQLTAYAISNCLTFVNNGVMFETKPVKSCAKLKSHAGYKCLKELLELMKKNKLEKNFNDTLSLTEAVGTLAWIGITLLILTSIRGIIHMYLTTRVKLSEYLDTVKDYVELNQANVRDPKIKAKQQKWVVRLEKMRDKISIDQEIASQRATEEIQEEDQEQFNADAAARSNANDLGLL